MRNSAFTLATNKKSQSARHVRVNNNKDSTQSVVTGMFTFITDTPSVDSCAELHEHSLLHEQ